MAKADGYAQAFQTVPYFNEAPWVGFNLPGYELGLMLEDKASAAKMENVRSYSDVADIDA